jgi:hypothetical protein
MDVGRGVISVEFVLSSEPLKLEGLTIKTFDAQEPDIWKILSRSDDNLHVGGIYSWSAESTTYNAITFLYRAQGKLVGVIPDVKLDYKQGKAWVNLLVVEGPATLKHPLSPPYGEGCDDHIMYVDWTSSDDGIPFDLIESGLTLLPPPSHAFLMNSRRKTKSISRTYHFCPHHLWSTPAHLGIVLSATNSKRSH